MAAADVIKIARTLRAKSLRDLGADSNIDFTVLCRLERGIPPTDDHVRRIARALRFRSENFRRAIELSNDRDPR